MPKPLWAWWSRPNFLMLLSQEQLLLMSNFNKSKQKFICTNNKEENCILILTIKTLSCSQTRCMCQLDFFSIYSVNYNFQFPIMTTQQYNNEKPTFLFYNIYMDKRELIQRATETIYEKLIYTLEREEQKRESSGWVDFNWGRKPIVALTSFLDPTASQKDSRGRRRLWWLLGSTT